MEPTDSLQKQAERTETGQFLPGTSGNPAGRLLGSRNRATLLAEQLFDSASGALANKAVTMALDGNVKALDIAVRNIIAPRRHRPCRFALPPLATAADAAPAIAAIAAAGAAGVISADEALAFSQIVETFIRALDAGEIEARLQRLESVNGIAA